MLDANGFTVRPTGKNECANDQGYRLRLQENIQGRCEKLFSGEDSDGSESSNQYLTSTYYI